MMRASLTPARMRELLDYEPDTGLFRWRVSPRANVKQGDIAGDSCTGYIRIKIDRVSYYAHCLAWLWCHEVWSTDQIDHIDEDKTNNRLENLRLATRSENKQNVSAPPSNNTSGARGVYLHKRSRKWVAQLRLQGQTVYYSEHLAKESAIAARRQAELKHHPFSQTSLIAKTMEALL